MHYLLRGLSKTKQSICELKLIDNVCWRAYRANRPKPEAYNFEVDVIGSGSFGDPASLLIKTCGGRAYVLNLWCFIEARNFN